MTVYFCFCYCGDKEFLGLEAVSADTDSDAVSRAVEKVRGYGDVCDERIVCECVDKDYFVVTARL